MNKQLFQLLWRHYRKRLIALGAISLLVIIGISLADAGTWVVKPGQRLLSDQVNQWMLYQFSNRGTVSLFPVWLLFVFWVGGFLLMNQDLKDHFNQFLFTSGYRRQTIYWAKLLLGLGVLLGITVMTTGVQYLVYWLKVPAGVTFNLAWPGVLASWGIGLANAVGMFAIFWFAALIIGQTGALIVTVSGFTLSVVGWANVWSQWIKMTPVQSEWVSALGWVVAALILFIWGSVLYARLSLEHNGEYLMFPGLKVPVYIVFVLYVTFLFSVNAGELAPGLTAFIISALFGYWWLWRPRFSRLRHWSDAD